MRGSNSWGGRTAAGLAAPFGRDGHLKVDELITARYPLKEINAGDDDMLAGKNIRGVLTIDG